MPEENDSAPLTRDIAPFGLRMPPAMKSQIKQSAEANNRSMNAEIVSAIKFYLDFEALNQTQPRTEVEVEAEDLGFPLFVNNAADIDLVVAELTKKYSNDLKRAMLGLLQSDKKEG